ncbi:MAG: hypothetical protein AB7L90_25260 [Hyphomicrobiaceae bacterium]
MARPRRLLSGAAKDAYLKRLLASEPGLDEAARERLTRTLQSGIALIARRHDEAPARSWEDALANRAEATSAQSDSPATDADGAASAPAEPAEAPTEPFDPYSPNVIVVFRTRGRDAALAELHSIEDVECLRLLAREQQLGIASDLADPAAIRNAIVAAAERRVANRRAAAS